MSDLRPPLAPLFQAFGHPVAATVTPPGGAAVAAVPIMVERTSREVPTSGGFTVTEPYTVVVLPRAQVPSLPLRSTIVAGAASWVVDGLDGYDDELVRAIVREA